jgi:mannose-1-phosphate guanylyltransferase
MAGGSGTRLWPESRVSRPKQFLRFGGGTMLAETVSRLDTLVPPERICVVAGNSMKPLVYESLPALPRENFIAEPAARNTAPCIGLSAVKLLQDDTDAVMLVLPADHVITPDKLFRDAASFAAELIDKSPECLVTLGIKPTFASTSYGYIQRGNELKHNDNNSSSNEQRNKQRLAFDVVKFHEKPPVATAEKFLADGNFYWNAGIFVWRAKTILELIERFEPEIGERLRRIADAWKSTKRDEVVTREFAEMKKISIDYAVMERAESIVVIESPFQWDDVGTWCALDRVNADKIDENGNLPLGTKLLAIDSRNNIVRANDAEHLFALLGVENLIVVQTEQATLIAKKDSEELVRKVIAELGSKGLNEYL